MKGKVIFFCVWLGLLACSPVRAGDWKRLHNGTLYVHNNMVFNHLIKNAVNQFWTFSKVEFVDDWESDPKYNKKDAFFLDIEILTFSYPMTNSYPKTTKPRESSYLLVLKQGTKSGKLNKRSRVYMIPIGDAGGTSLGCAKKEIMIPLFVKHFNWYANAKLKGKTTSENRNLRKAKGKELIILKDCTSKQSDTKEKVRRHYKSPVQIIGYIDYMIDWYDSGREHLLYYTFINNPGSEGTAHNYLFDAQSGALLHHTSRGVTKRWPMGLAKIELRRFKRGNHFLATLLAIPVLGATIPTFIVLLQQ